MVFNPAVRATGDVVIITRFLLIGKLSVWLDSKAEGAALLVHTVENHLAAVPFDDIFHEVQT